MIKKANKTTIEKKQIEESITKLTKESQDLIKQRNELNNTLDLIQRRLIEIQGGVNVLIPLLKD